MIIAIVGPTGIGKTALSISLAKHYNAEIINFDAMQVYEKMDIGTAKVTTEEMDGVVHHLLSYVNVNTNYSVYDYQKDARSLIDKLLKEKNLKEYKYYYILPDYRAANVIFTDKYLPNLENVNRNFLYGEEKFENFNQTEAYIELLKENPQSFKFFANSFFVEIAKNKLEENRNKICVIYKYSKRRI